MKSNVEVLQSVEQFDREIGAPVAIFFDAAGEKKSNDLRKFWRHWYNPGGLKEGTPWVNKDELYISLIKEAVIKYKKEYACPIDIWDYFVERHARINNVTTKIHFNLMDPTWILNWLEMKVVFPIYVGLSGTIGVFFTSEINNCIWIMRSLVKCLVLR